MNLGNPEMRTALAGICSTVLACAASLAQAQAWPAKPMAMLLPYAAGGPTDIVVRQIAQKMTDSLGKPVLVENAPGGNTMIAAERTAKAAPDGYTLLIASLTTLSLNPQIYKTVRYKVEDFAPISMMARTPYTLSITPTLPIQNVQEFIAFAKARPGQVFNGTTGRGASNHLLGEMFNLAAGIKTVDVPYKGSGPALTDVMGGQIHMLYDGIATAVPTHKSGRVRVLAVTSEQRSAALPDVPTFAELGYPDMTAYFWFGLVATAGTPRPVVDRLNEAVRTAFAAEDVKVRLAADGLAGSPGTPEALSAVIKRDAEVWGKAIKAISLSLD